MGMSIVDMLFNKFCLAQVHVLYKAIHNTVCNADLFRNESAPFSQVPYRLQRCD